MKLLSDFGLSSVLVKSDNLLRMHPFVGASFMDPARGDEQDAANEGEGEAPVEIVRDSIGHSGVETRVAKIEMSVQSAGVGGVMSESGRNFSSGVATAADSVLALDMQQVLNRRKEFVIDERPSLGRAFFVATNSVGAGLSHRV
ncbi:hypothetical protein BWQ96_07669 [Gracilariopsis chorda]|uniref:Uncharacterized protein n=1 Tax=Gracilariopsis chorda TaxID=448386 RepID=A0A2V3IKQ4_9FLOR|nr:hypothetical protein BWQ96_07669 [Gracilariopsis chorda]|eukprot:PXF42619.1 hypothetical protein BWQ96_07669 [Gracilariopsis chorda]